MIISEASLHMAGVNLKLPIEFSGLQMYVVYLCIERTQSLGLYLFCFSNAIIVGYDALLWGKTHTVLHGVEFRSVISFTKARVCVMETIISMAALNL